MLSTAGRLPAQQPPAAPAAEKPAEPPAKLASEIAPADAKPGEAVLLFDGKSLDGWKVTDFGLPGEAKAADGLLVIGPGTRLAGVTWTGKPLPKFNYEITAEARRDEGSDFFYGLTFPVQDTFCSLIIGGWQGKVVGLSNVNGEDASENQTSSERVFESHKWYRVRLRVTDSRIDAWLDDDQIVKLNYDDLLINVRLEMELNQPLGLATYRTKSSVRNLKIRKLNEAEVTAANAAEGGDGE